MGKRKYLPAVKVFKWAVHSDSTKDVLLSIILLQKVFQAKSFHEMSTTALTEILKSDDLDIDEKDILAAVREWATVNSVRDLATQYLWKATKKSAPIFYADKLHENDLFLSA